MNEQFRLSHVKERLKLADILNHVTDFASLAWFIGILASFLLVHGISKSFLDDLVKECGNIWP